MVDRYSKIMVFINCCPHSLLKKLMKAELNRHANCTLNYATCNQDCGPCLYYGDGWTILIELIDRVSWVSVNNVNINVANEWKSQFKALLTVIQPCTDLLKKGECNGNCSSCGL